MNVRRLAVWANLLVAAALMLLIWALVVWVASRPALKTLFDLTPQRINSVAPQTEDLLRDLRAEQAEIEFHLFLLDTRGVQGQSEAQTAAMRIRQRLVELTRTLLTRYAYLGAESVVVHEHQPYGDAQSYQEAAQAFGYSARDGEMLIVAVTMPGGERRHRALSLVSDLAIIDMPHKAAQGQPMPSSLVPVLKDYQGEKAISSTLRSLLVQGVPVAYLLKGYSPTIDFGVVSNYGYGVFVKQLDQLGFEVRELDLRQVPRVPTDASLVIVLEPRSDFAPRDADALYQYVEGGGRLFVNYSWAPADRTMNPTGGRLGELLGYRLSIGPVYHLIPDERTAGPGLDGNDAVAQLAMQVNRVHPTTRRIAENGQPLDLLFARALEEPRDAPVAVRREALLSTGPHAWLAVPDEYGQMDNRRPRGIQLRPFVVGMACEVDVPGSDDGERTADDAAGAPRTGQVVVVSGICCNNAAMPLYGSFALNVCNWMAERRVLLDIESNRYEARFLDIKPPQLTRVWWLMIVYLPGAFLGLGLLVWWRRRH